VEDLKRRLCYTSTIPFQALDSIILSRSPKICDLFWRSRSAEEDGWQKHGRRDIMEEWLYPTAPQVQKKKQRAKEDKQRMEQDSFLEESSSPPSHWNTSNIFDALEEPQYADTPQQQDPQSDEVKEEEEEQGKLGKFVPSAVGKAEFEERAHEGQTGMSYSWRSVRFEISRRRPLFICLVLLELHCELELPSCYPAA